jgi:hypothetical protein
MKMKGDAMAISIVLDLSEAISVHDLWQFLSFVPQWHDHDKDIRAMDVKGLAVRYLQVEVNPSPESSDRSPREAAAPRRDRTSQ